MNNNVKTFYRVGNVVNNQGLWYDMEGRFTGLIHKSLSFCKNRGLQMPYDPDISGYLSTVDKLEDLGAWFSAEDLEKLYPFGYRVLEYEATDYKTHSGHWLVNQETSVLVKVLN